MGLKHAYDFHNIMNTTNTLNHLVRIECGTNGLKLNIVHIKMESVWAGLHPLAIGESPTWLHVCQFQSM